MGSRAPFVVLVNFIVQGDLHHSPSGHRATLLGHTFRACVPKSLFGALWNHLELQGTFLKPPEALMEPLGTFWSPKEHFGAPWNFSAGQFFDWAHTASQ